MVSKSSKKGKKSSKKGASMAGAQASSAQVQAAKKALEKRLIFDVAEEAFSAASGTDEYGPENIVGVGASHKIRGDVLTNEPCVTVYVVAKVDKGMVASSAKIPETINGIQTDVVATGELHAFPYKGRYRPAPGGVSVGHFKITAGTLGCLVKKGSSLCILSNNHVLANSNNAAIGDPILQPGPIDGGTLPADLIAKLLKFIPIKFGGPANKVDCAIGKVVKSNLVSPLVRCYGKIKLPVVPCALNLLVKKCGRTTQFTRGRITDCTATVKVNFGVGIAVFTNQIIIQSLNPPAQFSAGGDSGSLIVTDQTSQPVGLLFAGSSTHTIANRIGDVLSALGVTIVT
jgi:Peptidase family S64